MNEWIRFCQQYFYLCDNIIVIITNALSWKQHFNVNVKLILIIWISIMCSCKVRDLFCLVQLSFYSSVQNQAFHKGFQNKWWDRLERRQNKGSLLQRPCLSKKYLIPLLLCSTIDFILTPLLCTTLEQQLCSFAFTTQFTLLPSFCLCCFQFDMFDKGSV